MQGEELLARGPAVVKGLSLSRGRLEETILEAQDKWSVLPRPLTAAPPDHTGVFLPNPHTNRRRGKSPAGNSLTAVKARRKPIESREKIHILLSCRSRDKMYYK